MKIGPLRRASRSRSIVRMLRALAFAAFVALAGPGVASSQSAVEYSAMEDALSREDARALIASAIEAAATMDLQVVVAVVDHAGFLIALERMDQAQLGSVDVAVDKARTSALFRRPTRAFQDGLASGATGLLGLRGVTPLEGGVPILSSSGRVIGAIGVSGATAAEDGQVASQALAAFENGSR